MLLRLTIESYMKQFVNVLREYCHGLDSNSSNGSIDDKDASMYLRSPALLLDTQDDKLSRLSYCDRIGLYEIASLINSLTIIDKFCEFVRSADTATKAGIQVEDHNPGNMYNIEFIPWIIHKKLRFLEKLLDQHRESIHMDYNTSMT